MHERKREASGWQDGRGIGRDAQGELSAHPHLAGWQGLE